MLLNSVHTYEINISFPTNEIKISFPTNELIISFSLHPRAAHVAAESLRVLVTISKVHPWCMAHCGDCVLRLSLSQRGRRGEGGERGGWLGHHQHQRLLRTMCECDLQSDRSHGFFSSPPHFIFLRLHRTMSVIFNLIVILLPTLNPKIPLPWEILPRNIASAYIYIPPRAPASLSLSLFLSLSLSLSSLSFSLSLSLSRSLSLSLSLSLSGGENLITKTLSTFTNLPLTMHL
jgi:hypothetical protein